MLNPNDTVRVPRFHPRTPPGRALEVGWVQEFGRWLWHLFVLPTQQAKPWPPWVHRFVKPGVFALARQLKVFNARSLRSWVLGLLLIDPPQGAWSKAEEYKEPGLRFRTMGVYTGDRP